MEASRVDPRRIHALHHGTASRAGVAGGPVVYWMHRDHRVRDNFGLLHAQDLALAAGAPLLVCHCLSPRFLDAALRQYAFLVAGLKEVARDLASLSIPHAQLSGDPLAEVPAWLRRVRPQAVVTDFDSLRLKRQWIDGVAARLDCPVWEVDSRNVVPCRAVSGKREYAARTIRPKIHRLLPEFFHEPPAMRPHPHAWSGEVPPVDFAALEDALPVDRSIPPVRWLASGPAAAEAMLADFIAHRLERYEVDRNNPVLDCQSNLSPYLHFGQLSPLRAALAVQEARAPGIPRAAREAFLEEAIVRRELSDNFCLHTPDYDSLAGCPDWAREQLELHRHDPRAYVYDLPALEQGRTHDALWNAAQVEMVKTGKMHGYLRMYWAKKILEWTDSPETAMAAAIRLNDAFELDGRDPNGYTGVAWSIGGLHDRPWKSRPVFGSIRYMNEAGCRRKFDVDAYIRRVAALPLGG